MNSKTKFQQRVLTLKISEMPLSQNLKLADGIWFLWFEDHVAKISDAHPSPIRSYGSKCVFFSAFPLEIFIFSSFQPFFFFKFAWLVRYIPRGINVPRDYFFQNFSSGVTP